MVLMPNNGPDEATKPHTMAFPKEGNLSTDHAPLRGRWSERTVPEPSVPVEESRQGSPSEPVAPTEPESTDPEPEMPTDEIQTPPTIPNPAVPLVEDLRHLIRTLDALASAFETIDTLLHQDIGAQAPASSSEASEPRPTTAFADILTRPNARPDLHSVLRQYLLR
ncbi:MAG: hypothetical protein OWR62_02885 [Sulfobacillus thermotolerans]|uniref:Uncharacterized protein n=1 Tax=Sulfobacillus thermotolerans TaxID=338644 RepID=A0ABM6RN86_9FIRM|nr:hypothetical protein BXT84_01725 [Sulfobacillus thermotolerans]MCY0907316.1 hypothetical protein [Sulfobacillus thermotolerans]